MAVYLGILIFSFIFSGIAFVPFIDLMYRLHFTHHHPLPPSTRLETREFNKLSRVNSWKIGTPIGGGVLIITLTILLYAIFFPLCLKFGLPMRTVFPWKEETNVLFFTFISFGLLGLYDDIVKIFNLSQKGFAGLRFKRKTIIQIFLCLGISLMLYQNLGISVINLPYLHPAELGWTFIPIAALIIYLFSRGYDITDGLDGLANGIFLICLLAFWAISVSSLDVILSVFIAIISGSLLAFMYFNVYPARIWLGNAGSLAFGATLAVTGLLLGKTIALFIIGGIYLFQVFFQGLQYLSVGLLKRKIISVSPIHYFLLHRGWPEPKIVMRFWLVSCLLAFLGLWLATA